MNDTRQPPEYRQTNINEEISAASTFQENGDRWKEKSEEVEEDIAC